MAGKKGRSGRKSKRVEWNLAELKELSIKRAIFTMKKNDGEEEDKRLEKRKDEITLKVLDKYIPQEIKLNGKIEHDFSDRFFELAEAQLESDEAGIFADLKIQPRITAN